MRDWMLSAETAAGKYPLETVIEMASICLAAEQAYDAELDLNTTNKSFRRIDQSIAMGALFTAHHCGAKAIVAMTESGSTALWMSRFRAVAGHPVAAAERIFCVMFASRVDARGMYLSSVRDVPSKAAAL